MCYRFIDSQLAWSINLKYRLITLLLAATITIFILHSNWYPPSTSVSHPSTPSSTPSAHTSSEIDTRSAISQLSTPPAQPDGPHSSSSAHSSPSILSHASHRAVLSHFCRNSWPTSPVSVTPPSQALQRCCRSRSVASIWIWWVVVSVCDWTSPSLVFLWHFWFWYLSWVSITRFRNLSRLGCRWIWSPDQYRTSFCTWRRCSIWPLQITLGTIPSASFSCAWRSSHPKF